MDVWNGSYNCIKDTFFRRPFSVDSIGIKSTNTSSIDSKSTNSDSPNPPMNIVWRNVVLFAILHIWAIYGFLTMNWRTLLFVVVIGAMVSIGASAGSHRHWSHRSFKAKLPLRIILMIFQTMAIQNDIYEWSRDHRLHHKYSETNADPHNSKRGFFFSHMGWLMVRKHPDVKEKGKTIDMSDVWDDPVVRFQRKYYVPLVTVFSVVTPSVLPVVLWQEDFWDSLSTCFFFRYVISLHFTWTVNSIAHTYGKKPYDRFINPSENILVSALTYGDGYHNFHHTFPCDYAASEHGWKYNLSAVFIDFMAWLGLAYDLKRVSADCVKKRKERTGTQE